MRRSNSLSIIEESKYFEQNEGIQRKKQLRKRKSKSVAPVSSSEFHLMTEVRAE
jgi:hypothetical protein